MRIILDTVKGRIILLKSFFTELDKINKILADGGSNKSGLRKPMYKTNSSGP